VVILPPLGKGLFQRAEVVQALARSSDSQPLIIPLRIESRNVDTLGLESYKWLSVPMSEIGLKETVARVSSTLADLAKRQRLPAQFGGLEREAADWIFDQVDQLLDTDISRAPVTLAASIDLMSRIATSVRGPVDQDVVELTGRVLQRAEALLGTDHPSAVSARIIYANSLDYFGDYENAIAIYRRALSSASRVLGPEHPTTLSLGIDLAEVLLGLGRGEEAEGLVRASFDSSRRIFGEWHPVTMTGLRVLTQALRETGKHDQAVTIARDALDSAIQSQGEDSVAAGEARNLFESLTNGRSL
jgi:tetratricopeptide (TPR) repeat protein